ncbi:GDSL-type esterase/lipase family protein [Crossiella sp. SN42]|uniref:GDSL-type esterase/lipase family protein n=1 Tax=Crossiella sp. SN42 TaxID=2944808 RepID=UPI00207C5CE4|nr:GDSL-type esterase/lipase family protein [Crossiella sp. SN42]MCO1580199.1 GDSL-type esterase/lipase family protein [Crossiella sp. SN42]
MTFFRKRLLLPLAVLITQFTLTAGAGDALAAQAGQDRAADCAPAASTAAAPKIKVWLAGDSTMANPNGSCPAGWGSQFGSLFTGDATVVNSAVGGRSVQTWLYESNVKNTKGPDGECVVSPKTFAKRWLDMLNPDTGMRAGDYLIIQFGINDGSASCPRHVGSARYQELLSMMAKAAKDRGAHPVLLTPVSALRCQGGTAVASRGFLRETADAATRSGAPLIDLHRLSYTLYNSLKFCPHDGNWNTGPVGAFFCNDHTHFERAGALRIAGVVAKALRDQRIGLASYLR